MRELYVKVNSLLNRINFESIWQGLIGDIIKHEYLSETIEGMAEYAGSMALKQISRVKYENRVNGYIENLRTLDKRFFHTKRMLYYTGAVFCILMSELGLPFYHPIGKTELTLFDIVTANTAAKKPPIEYDGSLMITEVEKLLLKKKQQFAEFLSMHQEEIIGDFFICGYDPMNMIRLGDMILCSHFAMLKSSENSEQLFLQGPVIVNMENDSVDQVRSYIK